ncbi:TIGR03759 family integrating conjugative element protein [Halopseudomonas xiamenensis]|uniref:TIGR03759 family integrating conjugative element protein n=1 Tax=Halopseudomonas xiamenensis TaxID=157792 RepID=UPI001627E28D|nr:TIGR03759 family integrating conjugative element protein [Halopseudomonas xiamenensis]
MANLLSAPFKRLGWGLVLSSLAFQLQAHEKQSQQQELQLDRTESAETQRVDSRAKAAEWGLTDTEWERYESLMAGRRGILSPGLDPLTALGVEARTDQERRRYAELQARFEYERIERELAYQRSYDEAIQRIAGDQPRVSTFTMKPESLASAGLGALGQAASPVRYDVIVAMADCSGCDSAVRDMVSDGRAVNVWVVDSDNDDGKIRRWATGLGIPVERVTSGSVTLNHGTDLDVSGRSLPIVRQR